ncbi:MAG: hypothetical protein IJ091_11210 [Oscillospiraceae bacterium]|nr:hypothetical protein [Oscillospiraceae bacterium]
MSENWIVQNLNKALAVWDEMLGEIYTLVRLSPTEFRGGTIWTVVESIHGSMQAVGYALLVLFFVADVMRNTGSFAELRRPEHALRPFLRFAISKAVISHSMELLLSFLNIVSGMIGTIAESTAALGGAGTELPQEMVDAIEGCGFLESIPLWAIALICSLAVWVLSFTMVLTVYGRFFKLFLFAAIAPVPLSSFAGEPTQEIGKSFLRSFAASCLEGAAIILSCVIFSVFAATPPNVEIGTAPATMVWSYFGELIFNMLILVGAVKMSDRVSREIMGV